MLTFIVSIGLCRLMGFQTGVSLVPCPSLGIRLNGDCLLVVEVIKDFLLDWSFLAIFSLSLEHKKQYAHTSLGVKRIIFISKAKQCLADR